jgi:hypothetical protein
METGAKLDAPRPFLFVRTTGMRQSFLWWSTVRIL